MEVDAENGPLNVYQVICFLVTLESWMTKSAAFNARQSIISICTFLRQHKDTPRFESEEEILVEMGRKCKFFLF